MASKIDTSPRPVRSDTGRTAVGVRSEAELAARSGRTALRVHSEAELAALCLALGARQTPGWSPTERTLAAGLTAPPAARAAEVRDAIRSGGDPLGENFCALRSPTTRRRRGATYTPWPVVRAMVEWAAQRAIDPARVIDPGCGSGRFLVAAGHRFAGAMLVGIEADPLAALMARAHLAVHGLAGRAEVRVRDYRRAGIEPIGGRTLFMGNPPYVRHHHIGARWKDWLSRTARAHGFRASQLAGLHVHFFLASLAQAACGDVGTFITAAEWLDVNYGRLVRELLAGPLGLLRVDLVQPQARVFEDALTTAAIVGFEVGSRAPLVRLRRLRTADELDTLTGGRAVARSDLAGAPRWTPLFRRRRRTPRDLVELGELCAVHRGQATGSNGVWIAGSTTPMLPPACLVAAVTRAQELFRAGRVLGAADHLRRVIDLPVDLDAVSGAERRLIDRFLRWARNRGAHEGYIARHRSPWWSVKLRAPAPILATYMARRPPAFVRNTAAVRHLNIAHGIYPRAPLTPVCLDALVAHLSATVSLAQGRAYAGGLTKFEPREMERLLVPTLTVLQQSLATTAASGERADAEVVSAGAMPQEGAR